MSIIQVSNLTKDYRNYKKEEGLIGSVKNLFKREYFNKRAVDKLSFEIGEGEIVGFLGPNGSGKTTTLKMLSGLLNPSEGTAKVMNYTPWERHNNFRRQFSIVMGQKNQLWWDLPAIESFNLNKIIYQIEEQNYREILNELVELLEVESLLKVPVRTLSLGERMKMELIGALLHKPRVLFLDEPTIGLDLVSQKKIQDFIKLYNQRNRTTIMLTSHYMSDIDRLCERVIIISSGKIIYDGSLADIKMKFSTHKIFKIKFLEDTALEGIEKLGQVIKKEPFYVELKIEQKEANQVSRYIHQNYELEDITISETPIEDVITEAFKGGRDNEQVS